VCGEQPETVFEMQFQVDTKKRKKSMALGENEKKKILCLLGKMFESGFPDTSGRD
jgi:hypothetical protein